MSGREARGVSAVLPPVPQGAWGGLAVVNFTCGGAGAGAVLGTLVVSLLAPVSGDATRAAEALGVLLAAVGFAAVGAEAGRPLRGINVFRHLRRSWMSREALAAAAFGAFSALDIVMPGPWQRGLAAAAALGFLLSQGFILFAARAVPAWATWEVLLLFVTSGLAKGMGIVLLLMGALGEAGAMAAAVWMGAGVVLMDLLVWVGYAESPRGAGAKQQALGRACTTWVGVGIVGLGHLLPLAALAIVLGAGGPGRGPTTWTLTALAGLAMAAGGAILKWALVRRAGLLHPLGIALARPLRPGPAVLPDRPLPSSERR